MNFKLPHTK